MYKSFLFRGDFTAGDGIAIVWIGKLHCDSLKVGTAFLEREEKRICLSRGRFYLEAPLFEEFFWVGSSVGRAVPF